MYVYIYKYIYIRQHFNDICNNIIFDETKESGSMRARICATV